MEISISDNGPGIPDDIKSKIFDPLFSSKITGIGLGLPVVKKIISLHNGKVIAESKEGEGLTIRVFLPYPDNDD